jgi:hypothetical protein
VDMLINLPNIQLVDNPVSADFIIAQSTFDYPKFFSKTIYIAVEPPRAWHRILMYGLFDNFHTVICHNPDKKCKNQFPFTPDDSPQYFPTKADPFKFNTRTDTKLRNRGVFYAGMVNVLENTPDAHGGINITPLRQTLGKYFKNQFPDSIIIGIGWDGQQTKINDWRKDKHERIMKSNCDFVLALENTIYPNYLYEKIWDGFSTDYVTLYLGDPRIEHHIPTNCFIDLRPYFNIQTKQFDVEALGKRLKEMTQTEYDSILENARKFRETAHGKHRYYQIKLTQFIYDRMKHGKATFD